MCEEIYRGFMRVVKNWKQDKCTTGEQIMMEYINAIKCCLIRRTKPESATYTNADQSGRRVQ